MKGRLALIQERMRGGAVALALLAVLFVLARPICAAQEIRPASPHAAAAVHMQDSPQGSDHSIPCCDSMEASVIATPPALAVPAVTAILTAPAFVHLQARIAPVNPVPGIPPPPPLSYHARSARIQR